MTFQGTASVSEWQGLIVLSHPSCFRLDRQTYKCPDGSKFLGLLLMVHPSVFSPLPASPRSGLLADWASLAWVCSESHIAPSPFSTRIVRKIRNLGFLKWAYKYENQTQAISIAHFSLQRSLWFLTCEDLQIDFISRMGEMWGHFRLAWSTGNNLTIPRCPQLWLLPKSSGGCGHTASWEELHPPPSVRASMPLDRRRKSELHGAGKMIKTQRLPNWTLYLTPI